MASASLASERLAKQTYIALQTYTLDIPLRHIVSSELDLEILQKTFNQRGVRYATYSLEDRYSLFKPCLALTALEFAVKLGIIDTMIVYDPWKEFSPLNGYPEDFKIL